MLGILSNLIFSICIGFYLIICLQWFSYKINRVIFHFPKIHWHIILLIIPTIIFEIFNFLDFKFLIIIPILYTLLLGIWYKKLDKKLIFTQRVKFYFAFLIVICCIFASIGLYKFMILSVIFAIITSNLIELVKLNRFKKRAKTKINKINPKIILITASFGKTSIKNFLFELLKDDYKTHKTPKSVNTLIGIIKDINEKLPDDTEIYIVEAGARERNDIFEISNFLNPQIVIVGEIGEQHLEYFKSIDNIRDTKLKALCSNRLQKAFLHSSTLKKQDDLISIYDDKISDIKADLDGINWKFEGARYSAKILGEFNAYNLSVCIMVAKFLGINDIDKKLLKIKPVEHRLQIISKDNKFIIDDGFNGNLSGMMKSYELIKLYNGRKVIITPGLVENSVENNEILAKKINEIFDLVIISSLLNARVFENFIDSEKLIILKDKNLLIQTLSDKTKTGDLILFSNDAPNFI